MCVLLKCFSVCFISKDFTTLDEGNCERILLLERLYW